MLYNFVIKEPWNTLRAALIFRSVNVVSGAKTNS